MSVFERLNNINKQQHDVLLRMKIQTQESDPRKRLAVENSYVVLMDKKWYKKNCVIGSQESISRFLCVKLSKYHIYIGKTISAF